ncbi:MAG: hypothetical protein JWR25_1178 [Noviherbaspirillum sp.]|nr:hypothetical protein [Noviherbaspirillum sp.]
MKITTIGIDLAKHVFQVHGVGASGYPISAAQSRLSFSDPSTTFHNILGQKRLGTKGLV